MNPERLPTFKLAALWVGKHAPRLKRIGLSVVRVFALLFLLALVFYFKFILDWDARPICHKGVFLAMGTLIPDEGWQRHAGVFPNVNGKSQESLATINKESGNQIDTAKAYYNYVPGLRQDDPGDLVHMYINRPTRWIWHGGTPPTIFKETLWLIVPVDFGDNGMNRRNSRIRVGEMSESLSLHQFRDRLSRTIDFIRTNERPNWRTIVEEHTKFLNSIRNLDR